MQSGKTLEVFHGCLGATYDISIDCKIYLMLNLMASLQSLVFLHAYFQTFSSSTWASHHLALQEAEPLHLSARLGGERVVLILLYVANYLDLCDRSSRGGTTKPGLPPIYISFGGAEHFAVMSVCGLIFHSPAMHILRHCD